MRNCTRQLCPERVPAQASRARQEEYAPKKTFRRKCLEMDRNSARRGTNRADRYRPWCGEGTGRHKPNVVIARFICEVPEQRWERGVGSIRRSSNAVLVREYVDGSDSLKCRVQMTEQTCWVTVSSTVIRERRICTAPPLRAGIGCARGQRLALDGLVSGTDACYERQIPASSSHAGTQGEFRVSLGSSPRPLITVIQLSSEGHERETHGSWCRRSPNKMGADKLGSELRHCV